MGESPPHCSTAIDVTGGEVVGLSFTSFASFISLFSVVWLLILVTKKYCDNMRSDPGGPWRLLRTNLDAYMLNLLVGEIVVSIGGVLDMKWAIAGKIECGAVCSAQGAMNIIGVTTTALFTLAITIHTWYAVYTVGQVKYSLFVWLGVSTTIWVYIVVFALAGIFSYPRDGSGRFFVPSPRWCSTSTNYEEERILVQYLWIWLSSLGGIVFYGLLFLFSLGNLDFHNSATGGRHWVFHLHSQSLPEVKLRPDGEPVDLEFYDDVEVQRELRSDAWKMLLYPVAYTLQTLGTSVIRWVPGANAYPLRPGVLAAHIIFRVVFRLSGAVNVLLFLKTRPNMLLFGSGGVLGVGDPRRKRARPNNVSASKESVSGMIQMERVGLEREF